MAKRPTPRPPAEPPALGAAEGARLLRELAARGKQLASSGAVSSEDQRAWNVAVEESLSAALGRNHDSIGTVLYAGGPGHVISLGGPRGRGPSEAEQAAERARDIGLQVRLLEEHAAHLERLASVAQPAPAAKQGAQPIVMVQRICERFHAVTKQLRHRHDARPTLDVGDEYDVQDLLHALLRVEFEDVRPEEWTPSYAGGAGRMDFLLKSEQLVIETKMARAGHTAKKLGDELLIDIARYQQHPDCRTLVCFVYDPLGLVANPRGVERDLGRQAGDFEVSVLIRPR